MDKRVKKLVSVLLTAIMILSFLPADTISARETNQITVGELRYVIITEAEKEEEGTVSVIGIRTGNKEKIIKVPSSVIYKDNKYRVVMAGNPEDGVEQGQKEADLWGKLMTSIVLPKTVTKIGSYAFLWCSTLSSIEIPEGVTEIGEGAFLGCSGLTDLTFAKKSRLRDIGGGAFLSSGIRTVELPGAVKNIGTIAFGSCFYLRRVWIPKSVVTIGTGAFSECTNILSLKVEEGNKNYKTRDNALFTADGRKLLAAPSVSGQYKIPQWVEIIEDKAFSSNAKIKGVTIPDTVISIGTSAFEDCEKLENVEIPNSVLKIGIAAFSGCTIKKLAIPGSVKEIGAFAFLYNDLRSLTLGEGVGTIGEGAFQSNMNLEKVRIPASVTLIEGNAFGQCTRLVGIEVAEGNDVYAASGSMLLDVRGEKLISYPSASGDIIINNTVKIIGEWAFSGSDITKAVIPASVDEIERGAFYGCMELERVEFHTRNLKLPEELYDTGYNDNRIFGDTPDNMLILIPRDPFSPPLPAEYQFVDVYDYWDALKTYYDNYQDKFRYALALHSNNARVVLK